MLKLFCTIVFRIKDDVDSPLKKSKKGRPFEEDKIKKKKKDKS